jgi:pyruvate,water dikinase
MGRIPLEESDSTQRARVGGKAANLGELSRLAGVRVPRGFCVTPDADLEEIEVDETVAWAVRSSATSEDSPSTSFAGLHDTFLNVVGRDAVRAHVKRCRESLSSERAITYRRRNGIADDSVHMAVVVQEMVPARVSGVLFTADPVSGNRTAVAIEAVAGLGEALVSGRVTPEVIRVGQPSALLTEAQITELIELGRRIEAHFGRPQDIEWCLAEDGFFVVQSRPITTLFPVPESSEPGRRVYLSVGHQQMMTDSMRPLGRSLFQLTAGRPMFEAGSRLFVDVTQALASPPMRDGLLQMMRKSDVLMHDALLTVLQTTATAAVPTKTPTLEPDEALVRELIANTRTSLETLAREIATKSGPETFDFILEDLKVLKQLLFEPRSHAVVMAGIEASWWLNEHLEKGETDVLTQSVPNNVTSEMGLALIDVADVIRASPELVAHLEQGRIDALRPVLQGWLDAYGMRCVGEIDVTRPRWSEQPSSLIPLLLSHVKNLAPGAGRKRFEEGRLLAERKEREVLARPGMPPETKQMIARLRTFIGYREFPKYGLVCRHFLYKQALMREAGKRFHRPEDAFFLTFHEFHEAVRSQRVPTELIAERKETFREHQALTPPRVITSDGETFSGSYRRGDVPAGALVGLAVSTGVIEGRARVIRELSDATVEPGDILVTAFTDPSWTPLFVAIKGLVTEVGGLMTHGAVIAREYGLPAVVSVEGAMQRIRDGQHIRVNGTDGFVELLD